MEEALHVVDHHPEREEVTVVDVTPVSRMRSFHDFSLRTPEFIDDPYRRLADHTAPPEPADPWGSSPRWRGPLDPDARPWP